MRGNLWVVDMQSFRPIGVKVSNCPPLQRRLRLYESEDGFFITEDDRLYDCNNDRIIELNNLSFVDVKRVNDYQQLLLSSDGELFARNLYELDLVKIIDKVEYICRCKYIFIIFANNEWKWLLDDDVTKVNDVSDNLPLGRPIDNYDNLLVIDNGEDDVYYRVRVSESSDTINTEYGELVDMEEVTIPSNMILILQYNHLGQYHISRDTIKYMTSDGRIWLRGVELKDIDGDTPWVELHQRNPWIGSIIIDQLLLLYNNVGDVYRINRSSITKDGFFFQVNTFVKEIFIPDYPSKSVKSATFIV